MNYKTTYHSSIDCEPSRDFNSIVPLNIPDYKLGPRFNLNIAPTTPFAADSIPKTKILYDRKRKNVMQFYTKFKKYYDKKAEASPFKKKDYCFLLQPQADHHGSKISYCDVHWIGPSLVEKVLPNDNYLLPKPNTYKTQILQRIRLRKHNA